MKKGKKKKKYISLEVPRSGGQADRLGLELSQPWQVAAMANKLGATWMGRGPQFRFHAAQGYTTPFSYVAAEMAILGGLT